MPEITRRRAVAGVGTTIMTALAGCSSSDVGVSSEDGKPEEFKYIEETQETVIGDGTEVQSAVIVTLTDFAVSRHSAASEVLVHNSGEVVGNSSMVDSNSLTIPIAGEKYDLIVVVDDDSNTLAEYKP